MSEIKLHIYFWLIALTSFIFAITNFNSDAALDINVHDTYYIIPFFHLILLLSIVLAFTGFIYYLHFKFNIYLFKTLSKIHLVGTAVIFVVLILGFIYFKIKPSNPSFPLFDDLSYEIILYSLSFLVFSVLKIIFIFNSIFSTILYLLKKNNS